MLPVEAELPGRSRIKRVVPKAQPLSSWSRESGGP